MFINRYQYNINLDELEITDAFRINEEIKPLTNTSPIKIYLSSDDPAFHNGIYTLNEAKRTDANEEVIVVYALNEEDAKQTITNYMQKKIETLESEITYYQEKIKSLETPDFYKDVPVMHFSSPKEMQNYLNKGNTIYNPFLKYYLFAKENSHIGCYILSELTVENVSLAAQEQQEPYWHCILGPIYYSFYNKDDFCQTYYQQGKWYDTKELDHYFLKEKEAIISEKEDRS